jgi:sialate O-acetylesterase
MSLPFSKTSNICRPVIFGLPKNAALQAIALMLLLHASALFAEIRLPAIFSDHVVLQRARAVPVWGAAAAGETVSLTLAGQHAVTRADDLGHWSIELDTAALESRPGELVVAGKNILTIHDVLIGEVWLASGQSNMAYPLEFASDGAAQVQNSADNQLREFTVPNTPARESQLWGRGEWRIAGPKTAGAFSAVAFFFARSLRRELHAPVGIINASFGGTVAEAWISESAIDRHPSLKSEAIEKLDQARDFPQEILAYQQQYRAWLAHYGRRDDQPEMASGYLAPNSDVRWRDTILPQSIAGMGIPNGGEIWLKKRIPIPTAMAGIPVRIDLGAVPGLLTTYWDGSEVGEITEANVGAHPSETFYLAAKDVIPGDHELTVRIFCPETQGEFAPFRVVTDQNHIIYLAGTWQSRIASVLPPLAAVAQAALPRPPRPAPPPQNQTSWLFNGMIRPLVPFGVRGVLWYQGEANESAAQSYRATFTTLIEDWRANWKDPTLPFYYCQLPNYRAPAAIPSESQWAILRESQSEVASLPYTGMAVLLDVGEEGDSHPRNKRTPGERLAQIALAKTYGKPVPFLGPTYLAMRHEGSQIRIIFRVPNGGLVARPLPASYQPRSTDPATQPLKRNRPDSQLEGFALCGSDRHWVWADARIENNTVVVWTAGVLHPEAIRYAWSDNPIVNLYDKSGLPAAPFRTDHFPFTEGADPSFNATGF